MRILSRRIARRIRRYFSRRTSYGIALTVIALLGIYAVVIRPEIQEKKIADCIVIVNESSKELWDGNCESKGKDPECTLDLSLAQEINNVTEKKKDQCIERYR